MRKKISVYARFNARMAAILFDSWHPYGAVLMIVWAKQAHGAGLAVFFTPAIDMDIVLAWRPTVWSDR